MHALCLILALLGGLCIQSTVALHIRLYTHNIRFNKVSNRLPNERPWQQRAPYLIKEILYTAQHPETFVMLQETLFDQLNDVLVGLNGHETKSDNNGGKDWTHVGVGRDDGKTKGEYSPILYRASVWQLQASETVWLCPDAPTVPSGKCWGANNARILTIARFVHRETGRLVVAMNTHLDNASALAREESAKVIQGKIAEWCRVGLSDLSSVGEGEAEREEVLPVFVAGDFNSPAEDMAYKVMTGDESLTMDLRAQVGEARRYGEELTFTGFEGRGGRSGEDDPPALIDFLFLGPKGRAAYWEVMNYACLPNVFDDGIYMSDHRAVVGDVYLKFGGVAAALAVQQDEQKLLG